jgi:formylglycine-generating enzyme required for sulfatase activity
MSKIFISYRRQDSRPVATLIYEPLARHFEARFGAGAVFMDVHGIPLGVNFRAYLNEQVAKADLLIALIADRWLTSADEHGARRIDSPNDFVRIEIEAALKRGVPVVPVYVDDAKFLREADLPDSLKDLAWMNGYNLSTDGAKFAASIASLIAGLEPHFAPPQPEPKQPAKPEPEAAKPGFLEGLFRPAPRAPQPEPPAAPSGGGPAPRVRPGSGESFRDVDAAWAPEMVVIPPGEFLMGSKGGEGEDNERPQHKVTIRQAFAVGKYPVTFAEWDAAVAQGGVAHKPGDQGWGRGRRPVIIVSWDDAQAYVKWLAGKTREPYRLLSEAEWEYACRAGTTTAYSFGDTISKKQAQFSEGSWGSAGGTVKVGSFPPNAFGVHDMHGNVWEWCEDCWNDNYNGAPADGLAWTTGNCAGRVLRGGSWSSGPGYVRAARRIGSISGDRYNYVGFRVARTLFTP